MTLQHPNAAQVLYNALRIDPFYRTLEETYPQPEEARSAMLRYYDLSICEAQKWGRLGYPADGAHWGISVWSVPLVTEDKARKTCQKEQALLDALGPECADCFARIEANMAVHEAALDLEDCWYLSILGVSPEVQGRGLGGELLAPVLKEADAKGVSSYLTTFTPRNVSFYAKHGYKLVGTFPESETGSDFRVLIRAPGGEK